MGQHVFSIIELSKKGTKSKIVSLPNMTNTFVANYNLNTVYYHNSTILNNEYHIES